MYWIVRRTSQPKEANLETEQVTWEHKVKMHLPKKRKVEAIEWEPVELPSFPVLVNKKPIKKFTELLVYLPDNKGKKEEKKK